MCILYHLNILVNTFCIVVYSDWHSAERKILWANEMNAILRFIPTKEWGLDHPEASTRCPSTLYRAHTIHANVIGNDQAPQVYLGVYETSPILGCSCSYQISCVLSDLALLSSTQNNTRHIFNQKKATGRERHEGYFFHGLRILMSCTTRTTVTVARSSAWSLSRRQYRIR